MATVFFFILISCIDWIRGMDNYSDTPESSNEEEQELDIYNLNSKVKVNDQKNFIQWHDYGEEKIPDAKNLSEASEENVNELKRKHKLNKILTCEFCQNETSSVVRGKVSGKALCKTCYYYEDRTGKLVPRDKRQNNKSRKHHIFECEFCQKEGSLFTRGKFSGKILCKACYNYESRYGKLVLPDERKRYNKKHYNSVCEFCQKESTEFTRGKCSGKSLCKSCYSYESIHGYLVSRYERKRNMIKHKDSILVCEFCQRESTRFITGKLSGKALCNSCYMYEYQNGQLVPVDERKQKSYKYTKNNQFNFRIAAKNYLDENKDKIEEKNVHLKSSTEQPKKQ